MIQKIRTIIIILFSLISFSCLKKKVALDIPNQESESSHSEDEQFKQLVFEAFKKGGISEFNFLYSEENFMNFISPLAFFNVHKIKSCKIKCIDAKTNCVEQEFVLVNENGALIYEENKGTNKKEYDEYGRIKTSKLEAAGNRYFWNYTYPETEIPDCYKQNYFVGTEYEYSYTYKKTDFGYELERQEKNGETSKYLYFMDANKLYEAKFYKDGKLNRTTNFSYNEGDQLQQILEVAGIGYPTQRTIKTSIEYHPNGDRKISIKNEKKATSTKLLQKDIDNYGNWTKMEKDEKSGENVYLYERAIEYY